MVNQKTRQIILASQSPQRRLVFQTLGLPFETIPADLDEKSFHDDDLIKRAMILAEAKALKIFENNPDAIIIAADTYVIDGEVALEKPVSLDEAREMLRRQSGRTLHEVSGVCYLDRAQGIEHTQSVVVEVTFRELSDQEIENYVTHNPVMTWSGAFSPAYHEGMALIAEIKGSFTGFTHGLPMEIITPLLKKSGVM